ncbi:MAG TPA: peptidoglycan DD-metalloendopeptidase family protein [Candidatus Manganitrophaceae bacterium]
MVKGGVNNQILAFTLLLGILLSARPLAAAPRSSALNEEIQKEKRGLEKLRDEIEGKREKSILIKKREGSILSDLERMDDRLRELRKEAALIEPEIKAKDKEMEYLSGEIKELTQEINEKRAIISGRLRSLYQERRGGSLKILFASQDYPDFIRRLHYLQTIARKEGELLALFKEKQLQLEEKKSRLGPAKEQLVHDKEALAQKLAEIRAEKRKKDQLLAKVQDEKSFHEKALAELDEASLQLQTVIKKLEEEQKRLKQPPSGKFSKERGRLGWPNDGEVVALFGRQKHPKFDAYIYRKGIDISPSKGEMVRAVFDGVVIYASGFRGYGMVIIIDHGENYYSIYAHLAKLLVSVGAKAGKNTPIGEVGETGLSQGNHLYFEIRHQGEPMDPLVWLQRRR